MCCVLLLFLLLRCFCSQLLGDGTGGKQMSENFVYLGHGGLFSIWLNKGCIGFDPLAHFCELYRRGPWTATKIVVPSLSNSKYMAFQAPHIIHYDDFVTYITIVEQEQQKHLRRLLNNRSSASYNNDNGESADAEESSFRFDLIQFSAFGMKAELHIMSPFIHAFHLFPSDSTLRLPGNAFSHTVMDIACEYEHSESLEEAFNSVLLVTLTHDGTHQGSEFGT